MNNEQLTLIKENEQNFCISQKISNIEDCKIMSNQAFMNQINK